MPDVGAEKSMDEILQQVQREYAEASKREVQPAQARSAEVHSLNQSGRKGRSDNRPEAPADAEQDPQVATNEAEGEELPPPETGRALAELAALYRARRRAAEFPIGNSVSTLEDIVRELLRPMLRQWLEDKLPEIIERLVKTELSRAIGEAV